MVSLARFIVYMVWKYRFLFRMTGGELARVRVCVCACCFWMFAAQKGLFCFGPQGFREMFGSSN